MMVGNRDEDFEEEDNEFMGDTDDSLENQKASHPQRPRPKIPGNISYKRNTLKFGKVRRFKYSLKNVGSLYLTTWVREDTEKDMDLYISSSNFRRDFSKRKVKDNQFYQS